MRIISISETETKNFAKKIASKLKSGDVLALYGDLGCGKTTFTQGLADGLGVSDQITSPTYTILKVYPLLANKKDQLIHIDCYRINKREDAESVGLIEFLNDKSSIKVIEWPERIENILPKNAIKIHFKQININERDINVPLY